MNKHLQKLLYEAGVYELEYVPKEKLPDYPPDKIIKKDGFYYFIENIDMTEDEAQIALLAKQVKHLSTIKGILLFYFICSLIAVALFFFSAII